MYRFYSVPFGESIFSRLERKEDESFSPVEGTRILPSDGNNTFLEIDLPGVKDLTLEIKGKYLFILGSLRERKIEKRLKIPVGTNEDKISSTFKLGVLRVTYPKKRQETSKKRFVKVDHE